VTSVIPIGDEASLEGQQPTFDAASCNRKPLAVDKLNTASGTPIEVVIIPCGATGGTDDYETVVEFLT